MKKLLIFWILLIPAYQSFAADHCTIIEKGMEYFSVKLVQNKEINIRGIDFDKCLTQSKLNLGKEILFFDGKIRKVHAVKYIFQSEDQYSNGEYFFESNIYKLPHMGLR